MKGIFNRKFVEHFDWPLFACVILILLIGLLNLFSATYNLPVAKYFHSQLLWVGIGSVLALLATVFDYRFLQRLAYPMYLAVILLLVLVMFKGRSALGAQRWVQIGPLSVQPSELAKLTIAIVLASYFRGRREQEAMSFGQLFIPVLLTAVPTVLILKQPDLGTAIIVAAVSGTVILFVGVRRRVFFAVIIAILVTAPVVWKYGLRPYQRDRVHTFLNPESDPVAKGYQIIQAKIAIGAGELTGKGFLRGSQSKLQFLPKQHTDFVFSNFAEEFGFIGSAILLALYASLSLLGLNVAYTAKDKFGMVLAFGLTAVIASQVVINLGMEMGLLPVVGVTLPMFSYGGTSLITTFIAVGLLLNISMRRFMF